MGDYTKKLSPNSCDIGTPSPPLVMLIVHGTNFGKYCLRLKVLSHNAKDTFRKLLEMHYHLSLQYFSSSY